MTDTGSSRPVTGREISSHGESHTSMSDRKSQGMSRVDTSDASPQVRKSRGPEEKVTPPLPREVTFSALSLRRAERDPRGGRDQHNTPTEPDDDDLAARRSAALDRLRRQKPAIRRSQP